MFKCLKSDTAVFRLLCLYSLAILFLFCAVLMFGCACPSPRFTLSVADWPAVQPQARAQEAGR